MPEHGSEECLAPSVDTSNSSTPPTQPAASSMAAAAAAATNDEPPRTTTTVDVGTETSLTIDVDVEVQPPQPARHVRLSRRVDDMDEMLTSADESELDPLQWRDGKDSAGGADKDAMSNSNMMDLDDDGDQWSKDFDRDSQSPTSRRRGSRIRCVIIALLVVAVVVGAAAVVVLLRRRLQVEPVYEFHFARYFGNHMVLQRAPSRAVIWGYGPVIADNASVMVTLDNNSTTRNVYYTAVTYTVAGPVWKVRLDPISDTRRPFTVTATLLASPAHTVQLRDVIFGDVWLCVGQNKLHHSVAKILNATASEEQNDAFHEIRLFSLFPAKSDMLWYDLRGIQLPWSVPHSMLSVTNNSAATGVHFPSVCWLFGKKLHARLRRPIGLVSVTYSGSNIDEWLPSRVIDACNVEYTDSSSRIWNGMIHPLLEFPIYGAIWHQDAPKHRVSSPGNYSCMVAGLVNYWRSAASDVTGSSTDPLFPIGIVQLMPHGSSNVIDRTLDFHQTAARWEQTANYGYLPNHLMNRTFLAVTIDLPDENTLDESQSNESSTSHARVHSQQKHQIASRLLLGALNIAYQESAVSYRGPWPTQYHISRYPPSLKLQFNSTGGLYVNRQHGTTGFEICCSTKPDKPCHPAFTTQESTWLPAVISTAQASSPNALELSLSSCDHGHHVVGVRYAWRQAPCELELCAVYSSAHPRLPMSPYIYLDLVADGGWHPLPQEPLRLA